jgi:hypothetical protein
VSNIGFALGLVGVAAGATLLILSADDDDESARSGWHFSAGASPHGGYGALRTRW